MYIERIEKLQDKLRSLDWQGMIICQNVDLYYLTGSMQAGYLYVPATGEPIFIVRRSVSRARIESAVRVVEWSGMKTLQQHIAVDSGTVALEFDVLPVQQFVRFQQAMPNAHWVDGSALIRELRSRKSPAELTSIERAAMVVDEAFCATITEIRPGMSELQLLCLIEQQLRARGHLGPMRMRAMNQEIFTGLVGAGASGATPTYFDGPAGGSGLSPAFPQSAGHHLIQAGEPILIDVGCNIDGYIIDQTRTVVIGSLPEKLQVAYDLASTILFELEKMLKPGTTYESLHMHALALADDASLAMNFMGYGADRVKFIGHGIGLEVDEWPVLAKGVKGELQTAMVIAIEPKFCFPGEGVVGIEDSYLLTADGFRRLTRTSQKLFTV
jgi:Xaa-Pro dipeptidase